MIKKYALLLLLCIPFGSYAQTTVSGTVTDNAGMPLPGASVVVEGSIFPDVPSLEASVTVAYNSQVPVIPVTVEILTAFDPTVTTFTEI